MVNGIQTPHIPATNERTLSANTLNNSEYEVVSSLWCEYPMGISCDKLRLSGRLGVRAGDWAGRALRGGGGGRSLLPRLHRPARPLPG